MAIQQINVGAAANDGTGDPYRNAMQKVNANFQELDTGKLGKSTAIANGTDLDTIGEGLYHVGTNAIAGSLLNGPVGTAGALLVQATTTPGVVQTYTTFSNNDTRKIYQRSSNSAGQWSTWARIYTTIDKPTVDDVAGALSNADLADLGIGRAVREASGATAFNSNDMNTFTGTNAGGAYTLAGTYLNGPLGAAGFIYTGVMQIVRRMYDAGAAVIQIVHNNGLHYYRQGRVSGETWTWDDWGQVQTSAQTRTIGGVVDNGVGNINLPGVNTSGNQNTSGKAATADTLATSRNFTLNGVSKAFNGGANVEFTADELTVSNPTGVQSSNGGQLAGNRNLLINGHMMIAHEGDQNSTVEGAYAIDCFAAVTNPAGKMAASKQVLPYASSPGAGIFNALRITQNGAPDSAAAAYSSIQTVLEGNSIHRLIGKTFTLSLYLRGNKAGNIVIGFRSGRANWAYTAVLPVTTAWVRQSVTITNGLPATWANDTTITSMQDNIGLQITLSGTVNADFKVGNAGAWNAGNILAPSNYANYFTAAGNWLDTTGWQLELGDTPTEFEFTDYAATIVKINRYAYLSDLARLISIPGTGYWGGGTTYVQFPVRMNRAPTISVAKVTSQPANTIIGAGDITHSGANVNFATDMSSTYAYAVFSLYAKAYPTSV